MAKLVNKFEIGCDPEFVVLDTQGRIVNVSQMTDNEGTVGWDHSGNCVELRPTQARGTWTVVKRLQTLINNPYPSLKPYQQHKWRAGAYIQTPSKSIAIGGHIHFGVTGITPERAKALDAVTKTMEDLEILPKSESIARRTHTQYGKWGDFRDDTSDKHIEYRVMASWLSSPWTAFLALTLGKLAIVDPIGTANLTSCDSVKSLVRFIESFKNKDQNVDRLLFKLDRDKSWLPFVPDADFKSAWSQTLERRS